MIHIDTDVHAVSTEGAKHSPKVADHELKVFGRV